MKTEHDIVIIDDDNHHLDYLSTLLSRWGHRTRPFRRAVAAMQSIEDWLPRVVITDVYMPDFDGIEVLREIQRKYPALPVIGISGVHEFCPLTAMRLLGAVEVLQKPLQPEGLQQAIQCALDRRAH